MPHLSLFTSHFSPPPAALHYNSALSIWLSVDPLSDKYLGVSPYVYCNNNPVRYFDPNGEEIGDYFNLNGDYLGTDGLDDGKIHVVSDTHWNEIKNTGYVAEDGTTVISSAFATADGFSNWFQKPSEVNLSDDAVFSIVSHYNRTGFMSKRGGENFALRTTFSNNGVLDIKINIEKWSDNDMFNNYYNILSTYDHEIGHIKQFEEIGIEHFNSQTLYEKEKYAVDYQRKQLNFTKTTHTYQKCIDLYLRSKLTK